MNSPLQGQNSPTTPTKPTTFSSGVGARPNAILPSRSLPTVHSGTFGPRVSSTLTDSAARTSAARPSESAASLEALRLELEHRSVELHLKQKTIHKLEKDVLVNVQAAEEARGREEEHIEAIAARAKKDSETASIRMDELRSELHRTQEKAEAFRLRIVDLEAELKALSRIEVRLKENERLLEDRTQRAEELREDRRRLEELVRELQRADQSNVLQGRLEAVSQLADQANARAVHSETSLLEKAKELDAAGVKVRTLEQHVSDLQRELGARTHDVETAAAEILRWKEKLLGLEQWMEDVRKSSAEVEAAARSREGALHQVIESLRTELRAEHKSRNEVELELARQEAESTVLRGQLEAFEGALRREAEYRREIDQRLRSYQSGSEEKDSELAREQVVNRGLRSEVEQQRALCDALRGELEAMRDDLRRSWQEKEEAQSEAARLQGAEEKLMVMRGIAKRQSDEMGHSEVALTETKERLAEAEAVIAKVEALQHELKDLRRECRTKGDAIDLALREKKELEHEVEAAVAAKLAAEGQASILTAKVDTERDRRRDLERRLSVLENGMMGNYAIHGRYEALKAFLESSNSEASKAQQLSFALLEEVKTLEGRLSDADTQLLQAREDRRSLEVRVVELQTQLLGYAEVKERAAHLTQELKMLHEHNFDLQKDSVDAQVMGERLRVLQGRLGEESSETLRLKRDLSEARAAHREALLDVERLSRSNEELNTRLEEDRARRDREHQSILSAAPDQDTTTLALRQMLVAEAERARAAERSAAELQRRLAASERHALESPSEIAKENASLKEELLRLESTLKAERDARLDQQARLDSLSGQLRSALAEVALYREERDREPSQERPEERTPKGGAKRPEGKGATAPKMAPQRSGSGRRNSNPIPPVQKTAGNAAPPPPPPTVTSSFRDPQPESRNESPVRASNSREDSLRRRNTELSLQLSAARTRLSSILGSPTEDRGTGDRLRSPASVVSPPRPARR